MRQFGWVVAALGFAAVARAEVVVSSAVPGPAERPGYRVRGVYWDPVLRQRWAVLENVVHPEQPKFAELTETSPAEVAAETQRATTEVAVAAKVVEMAVRSGDSVTLWSAEKNLRMQMTAVVQQSAGVGVRVQLRVTGTGSNGNQGTLVNGIVRGPGSVEME